MNDRIINKELDFKQFYINNSKNFEDRNQLNLFKESGKKKHLFCEKWKAANNCQGWEGKLYKNLIILSRFAEEVARYQCPLDGDKLRVYYEMLNRNVNSIIDDTLFASEEENPKESALTKQEITGLESFSILKKIKIRVYAILGVVKSVKSIVKRTGDLVLIYNHENAVKAVNQILEIIRKD